ncbi:MAG: alpha/beta hydrolase [Gemmatimonadaceae bacterium]
MPVTRTLRFLAIPVLGYGTVVGVMKYREPTLVYHPAERSVPTPDAQYALKQRAVAYQSPDGNRLTAWIIPAASADSSGLWMLICHGNYGNIGYGQRPHFYAELRDLGLNLMAFDYRGFGASEGAPSEAGLYADAQASYQYLRDSLGVPADRIVIFGHSLGSGVAIELATRVPSAGVVVEGAYTTVPSVGQAAYPWLPVNLIMSNRFASIEKVGKVTVPKLFIHSPEDDVIPFAFGQSLFAAAAEPKRFQSVKGGHMDAFTVDRGAYFGSIREFLAPLAPHGTYTAANGLPH